MHKMEISKKVIVSKDKDDSNLPKVAYGHHYALQVALQTVKERYQQVKERLAYEEGDNLNLRIKLEKKYALLERDGKASEDGTLELRLRIAQLERRESRLIHHVSMLSNENKLLWNHLSRATKANKSLGTHLSDINDTLTKRTLKAKETNSDDSKGASEPFSKENSVCEKNSLGAESIKEESLEEISLKLIKSFRQEKIELEDQYAQMVEIQAWCPPLELDLTVLESESQTSETSDDDTVLEDVHNIVERLRSLQIALQQQRAQLRSFLSHLETIKKEGRLCPRCQGLNPPGLNIGKTAHAEVLDVEMESTQAWTAPTLLANQDVQRQLQSVVEPPVQELIPSGNGSAVGPRPIEKTIVLQTSSTRVPPSGQWMCPVCSTIFSSDIEYKFFENHVLGHFADEDSDSESITNNYEIVQIETN